MQSSSNAVLTADPGTTWVIPAADENRRAKIRLGLSDLAALLDLPEGMRISHLYVTNDPDAVMVVVEGDQLAPVIPECEVPILWGAVHSEVTTAPDGEQYKRVCWQFSSTEAFA